MASDYQEIDWNVVDYHLYELDEEVLDRVTGSPFQLRGPRPDLGRGKYFVCLGAAQTFGRFCDQSFPTILHKRLGLQVLNFGRGGAGPSFFLGDNSKLISYINEASFVIVQVMSGRSEGNSLYESKGIGHYVNRLNGKAVNCDEAYQELIQTSSPAYVKKIVEETRQSWVKSYIDLFQSIKIPKILFWFSDRRPFYLEDYTNAYSLFGSFPQLINQETLDSIKPYCDFYIEYAYRNLWRHSLVNRFTGKKVSVVDPWNNFAWKENWYYPSPRNHIVAAKKLEKACRKCLLMRKV